MQKKGYIYKQQSLEKVWSSFPEALQLELHFLPLWQTPRGNLLLALKKQIHWKDDKVDYPN